VVVVSGTVVVVVVEHPQLCRVVVVSSIVVVEHPQPCDHVVVVVS
jgi:hypothetical protein